LENLASDQQQKVRQLLSYNSDTAGGIMNTDFVTVSDTATVDEAIEAIRKSNVPAESMHTVFVLDGAGSIVGAIAIGQLIKARGSDVALSVARTQMAHVHPHWDVMRVARKMSDFNLMVVPVLDEEHNALIGVVTVDDLLEEMLPQGWRREFGVTSVEE
jgi:magnesium transporter